MTSTDQGSTLQEGRRLCCDSHGRHVSSPWRAKVEKLLVRLTHRSEGQDLIEYALLTGFISLIMVFTLTTLGESVNATFEDMADAVNDIGGGSGGSGG